MTEEEAKTKWCPHKEETALSTDRCIGSDCMMWRSTDNECLPQSSDDRSPVVCKPAGFCGLAGKP